MVEKKQIKDLINIAIWLNWFNFNISVVMIFDFIIKKKWKAILTLYSHLSFTKENVIFKILFLPKTSDLCFFISCTSCFYTMNLFFSFIHFDLFLGRTTSILVKNQTVWKTIFIKNLLSHKWFSSQKKRNFLIVFWSASHVKKLKSSFPN